MNQSASPPPPPAARAGGRRNWNGLLVSVLGASAVFLAFAAYGQLAPTTYVATAQILLTPAHGGPLSLGGTSAPATRLRDAAIDDESLASAAQILKLGAGAAAEQAARQRLSGQLDVQASRPGVFDVSVRQSTAQTSQALCNLLARHAAAQVTRLFGGSTTDPNAAREAARTRAATELARFIAQHPELALDPVVTPVASGSPDAVDVPALRAERAQIEAKLGQLPPPDTTTDNPFEHASSDAVLLRRRLAEIDQTIATKRKAERKAEQATRLTPEVEAEWKRLLKEVGQPTVPATTNDAPGLTVMLREAALPAAPIHPNRRMVALVGALVSIATGALLALMMRLRRPARRLPRDPRPVTLEGSWQEPRQVMPTGTTRLLPTPGSDPPHADAGAVDPVGVTARVGSDPPRVGSDPPRVGSDPPRVGSDPPRVGSDPPRVGSDPPRIVGEPPRVVGEAPRVVEAPRGGSDPPRAAREPLPAGSDPPPPAAGLARTTSSNPPRPVESPVTATFTSPAPIPVVAIEPSTPVLDASSKVPKGTQMGLGRLDARLLERPAPAAAEPEQKAGTTPAPRAQGDGSTLRPPPPDQPQAAAAVLGSMAAHGSERPPEGGQADESWTGPSRAHRRSASARRTTQVMGSPIPPVVRGGSSGSSSWPPENQQAGARPAGSTYSYVTDRPEGARAPATPPYYSEAKQIRDITVGRAANRTPRPPVLAEAAFGERARILAQSVRSGWIPDPSIDFYARRALADQIFPLAVERCFVVGVVATPAARAHKTRVAAELAFALAEAGHPRVLLMEADFQWPAVHQLLHLDMPISQGLSQQLRARAQQSRDPWTVMECTPTLHVLAEGIIRSPGTILTVQFDKGLKHLRTYYDVVVLDGPDTSARSECNALSTVVDGLVSVEALGAGADGAQNAELFASARFMATVVV